MALRAPTSGLRRIHHNSIAFDKVNLSIGPGEVLFVSDDVAEQLKRASTQFKDEAEPKTAEPDKPKKSAKKSTKKSGGANADET